MEGPLGRTPLDAPERQQEVFAAVLGVLAEVGYARFNMDLVAGLLRPLIGTFRAK